jgi:hypothetical protein
VIFPSIFETVSKIDSITVFVEQTCTLADLHDTLLEEYHKEFSHAVTPNLIFDETLIVENPTPAISITEDPVSR